MAEYIEREALIEKIEFDKMCANTGYPKRSMTQKDIFHIIKTFPAADVAPVVHGRWEQLQDCEYVMCSACKEEFFDEYGSFENGIVKYCPNCGAKMDLEASDG